MENLFPNICLLDENLLTLQPIMLYTNIAKLSYKK